MSARSRLARILAGTPKDRLRVYRCGWGVWHVTTHDVDTP